MTKNGDKIVICLKKIWDMTFSPAIAHFWTQRPLFSQLMLAPTDRPYMRAAHS